MKEFFKLLLILLITLTLTACNERNNIEHLSYNDLIEFVTNSIEEDIQFVSVNTNDKDNYIYTFKLLDRNIDFEIRDYIHNDGLNIDNSQIFNNYKRSIIFNDYIISILNDLEQERLDILKKYGFQEIYYDSIGKHIITINDYDDLLNLSNYIAKLDNLYKFNIKENEKIEFWNVDLIDVIDFSNVNCSIEGISYSTKENARLSSDKVYKKLEEQYVKKLKELNLKDNKIPEELFDKY